MGLPLEKKTGTNFGPPGNSKLVYFLDDLNLSEVKYDILFQPKRVIIQSYSG